MKKFVMMIVALALACAPLAAQVEVTDARARDRNDPVHGATQWRYFSVRQGRPIFSGIGLSVERLQDGKELYEIQLDAAGHFPQAPDGVELNIDGERTTLRSKNARAGYDEASGLPEYHLRFEVDRKLFERLRVTNQVLTFTVLVGNQRYQTVTVGGEARQKFNTQMFKIMSDQDISRSRR